MSRSFRPLTSGSTILALLLALACSSPEEKAADAREEARKAIAAGQRTQALEALERLRKQQPDDLASFASYVQLLVQAGEAPRAVWELEQEVRRKPDVQPLKIQLANLLLLTNDPRRALEVVAAIPETSPLRAQAMLISGRAEQALGNEAAGNRWFDEVERLYPDYLAARIARLNSLIEENRSAEAAALLQELKAKVAGRPPDDSDRIHVYNTELGLYDYQVRSGYAAAAQPGIEALLAENPEDATAWALLARSLEFQGKPLEALERTRAALKVDPDRLWLYPIAIELLARIGDTAQQRELLATYAERSGRADAQIMLAQSFATQGKQEEALRASAEAVARHPDDVLVQFANAELLLNLAQFDDAEAALDRFRDLAPEDPRAEFLKGRLQLARGEVQQGRDTLAAITPQFDNSVSQYWVGAAEEALGDLRSAERRYRAALVRDPRMLEAHLALVRRAESRGDWETLHTRAIQFRSEHPARFEAWSALVTAAIQLGKLDEALEAARSLVQLSPKLGKAHVLLARAEVAGGRFDDAMHSLDAAAENSEKRGDVDAERAIALARMGRIDEALQVAKAARVAEPESAWAANAEALVLFQAGRGAEGAAAVDRALELGPGDMLPLRARAEFRTSTGDAAGARADLQRYLQEVPDDPRAHFVLGAAEAATGNTSAAIAAYRRAAELDPGDFGSRNNLAELLAATGDLDAALAASQEAFRIAPHSGYVLDTLGSLYLRKGLNDRALSLLEDALEAEPGIPDIRLHLAKAYAAVGRATDARKLLDGFARDPKLSPAQRSEAESLLAGLE
jgi:predicted Zn-dependent protease